MAELAAKLVCGEQELVADCTCPVCQELFQHPQKLAECSHTLCRKCIKKMCQKEPDPMEEALQSMSPFGLFGGLGFLRHEAAKAERGKNGSVKCPICRKTSDKYEQDENTEYLVKVLKLMRSLSGCSGADVCTAEANVQCPCCDKRLCQAHYSAQMSALAQSGATLLNEIDLMLNRPDEADNQPMEQLRKVLADSETLESVLIDRIHRSFASLRQQARLCQEELSAPRVGDDAERSSLWLDREALRRYQASNGAANASLARLLPEAKSRLEAAKRRWPQRELALRYEPDKLQEQLDGLLVQHASSVTYKSPYSHMAPLVTRVRQQNLTQKPWDICILTNLDGVISCDGALKFRSSVSSSSKVEELSGPLLVINAQSFPTKMLHVTDMEVKQVATIKPQFNGEGMPGRMHIYNQRQLILTSDSGRHSVSIFNLEGRLMTRFGEKGSGPRQFHAPLGVSASEGHMFVVDAKNRRVQVFDMDNDYTCLASIQHDGFTEGIQSVLATPTTVFVVDREKSRLFIFDRATRQPTVSPPMKLEGKPFDIAADEYGNALVTLVGEAKVLAVHRFGSILKAFSFKETHEGGGLHHQMPDSPFALMMPMLMTGGVPPRMFHGAAFEPTSRRLFVADLMRSCIVISDF